MSAQEMMHIDKADLVWRIITLEAKVKAQAILIEKLEDIQSPKFDPNEVPVGSIWECIGQMQDDSYFTKGLLYKVLSFNEDDEPEMMDDRGVVQSFWSLHNFKRVV